MSGTAYADNDMAGSTSSQQPFFGPFEKNSRMKKLKTQENNSKLKQKTQGFGKYSISVFLTLQKIDSKTAEILVKCRICIRKCKIDLKKGLIHQKT